MFRLARALTVLSMELGDANVSTCPVSIGSSIHFSRRALSSNIVYVVMMRHIIITRATSFVHFYRLSTVPSLRYFFVKQKSSPNIHDSVRKISRPDNHLLFTPAHHQHL